MDRTSASRSAGSWLQGSHPADLLYGAIVTAAVLVTAGGHGADAGKVVASWGFVLVIYWLAHIYVHAAESQFHGDMRRLPSRAVDAARAEVAVLLGGIPTMVVFVIAAATDADTFDAAKLALYFSVALLAAVGYIGARHAGHDRRTAAVEALGASVLGLLMVLAKTLLH
ncbi:MAG: hypothetical protein JWQ91_1093 [Aeromicrobium sp.]|uniref:hypothetical protein n=1 Tax=Aeromicrobium sp. TaxID=1871063 RepID=UPI002612E75C|nr:hypothetical protein [Aeromicrobium sp.]MCW2789964.1 hypothetical protein [Aeromicrobium sp.]MCW2824176.1 hypothetical protein [Aeromicrobium sp.]